MITNGNWIKLHRDLDGSFSQNPLKDLKIWNVYVFLLKRVNWQDSDNLLRGQCQLTIPLIAKMLPIIEEKEIRRIMIGLVKSGHIVMQRSDEWCNKGYTITICDYMRQDNEIIYNDQESESKVKAKLKQSESKVKASSTEIIEEFGNSESKVKAKLKQSESKVKDNTKEERRKKKEKIKEENTFIDGVAIDSPCQKSSAKKMSKSSRVFLAYETAFADRYRGVKPLRGAKTNKLLCDIVDTVGEERAIDLVIFYLQQNDKFYQAKTHDIATLFYNLASINTRFQMMQPIEYSKPIIGPGYVPDLSYLDDPSKTSEEPWQSH